MFAVASEKDYEIPNVADRCRKLIAGRPTLREQRVGWFEETLVGAVGVDIFISIHGLPGARTGIPRLDE